MVLAVVCLALVSGCEPQAAQPNTPVLEAFVPAVPVAAEQCPDFNPLGNVYFGDSHGHTSWSMDARAFGNRTQTPAEAFAFARGAVINHPLGGTARLDRPLDFLAVSDHAEFFDLIGACIEDRSNRLYTEPACQRLRRDPGFGLLIISEMNFSVSPPLPTDESARDAGRRYLWRRSINLANRANKPCSFTTFPAYEWTGGTATGDSARGNLHRNILLLGNNLPDEPYDARRYGHESQLWNALQAGCLDHDDCDAISIPHNSNMSRNGAMWTVENAEQGRQRAAFEPVAEMYQHKGDSECTTTGMDPADGGYDLECAFEKLSFRSIPDAGLSMNFSGRDEAAGMVRAALAKGLEEQTKYGFNPLQFGFIASTDDHNGTPGLVEESSYRGHHGTFWEGDEQTRVAEARDRGPGGLAAIWARANTRAELFAALRRREVYGTSGPRIRLRVYATPLSGEYCAADDRAAAVVGSGRAIPMGAVYPYTATSPVFVIEASADKAALQSVEMIRIRKDLAGTETRLVRLRESVPGVRALCAVWQDPDYDATRPGLYYVRVLEEPTPRWTWFACQRLPQLCALQPGELIRERAWSSPIWTGPATKAH